MYNSALEVNNLLQTKDIIKYLAGKHRQESENRNKLTIKENELLQNLQSMYFTGPQICQLTEDIRSMMICQRFLASFEQYMLILIVIIIKKNNCNLFSTIIYYLPFKAMFIVTSLIVLC